MENSTLEIAQHILLLVAAILGIGVLAEKVSGWIKIPDIAIFIISGILVGPEVLNLIHVSSTSVASQLILVFGSAYILYDGGREIKLRTLKQVGISVALLSTLGVIISAVGVGFIVNYVFGIPFIYALLCGSVIASTDPAVLVPLFKNMKLNDRVKQTIIAESAFNDAAGAVMTSAVLTIIAGSSFSMQESALNLIQMLVGGGLLGVVMGLIATTLVSHEKYGILREYISIVAIIVIISAYMLGEYLHVSGFMAVFVIGMVCGNKKLLHMRIEEESYQMHIKFKEVLTVILRISIFIFLGLSVDFATLGKYLLPGLLVTALFMFVVRPVCIFVCAGVDRKAKWSFKELLFMSWVRETGVIPAALSGMLVSQQVPYSDIIAAVTFIAIITTVLLQSSTKVWLSKKLKIE